MSMETLSRVRDLFIRQPIFRNGDGEAKVYFDLTDFVNPVPPGHITDIASCLVDAVPTETADVIVSVADRSSGAIAHEAARLCGLPYTLANWYPDGMPGEVEVERCAGFSGNGHIWLNGLKRGRRVILFLDVLRTGRTAANMVRACVRAGCQVIAVGFGAELTEFNGRSHEAFDGIPVHACVRLHVRGERTSEVKDSDAILGPTAAQLLTRRLRDGGAAATAGPDESEVDKVLRGGGGLAALRQALVKPDPTREFRAMDHEVVEQRLEEVSSAFVGVAITANHSLNSYPYSFFQLTDFVPLMNPDVVEMIADLAVHFGSFSRCDVIVAEADRGGAPIAIAIARRTKLPFVLANWYPLGEGMGASTQINIGFSGDGQIILNGVREGDRCTFVDDMLSSGGTAEGVLQSIVKLGGIPVQAVFASEKLYPGRSAIPWRKGKERLENAFPSVEVVTLAQFVAEGERTSAPMSRVG